MICARAGFNRTGFVVCAYLILVCGLSVQEALGNFAAARPPGVKHEKFVVEVSTFSSHTYSLSREILPPQTVRHTMHSRFCFCSIWSRPSQDITEDVLQLLSSRMS